MPTYARFIALFLVLAFGLVHDGCRRRDHDSLDRPRLRTGADTLRFTDEEENLIQTIGEFYAGLLRNFVQVGATAGTCADTAMHIRTYTDRRLPAISALSTRYAELDEDRKMTLHMEAFDRYHDTFWNLLEALSVWTRRFEPVEKMPEFKVILAEVFRPWVEMNALWVFEGFGEEAARELREIALGDEEKNHEGPYRTEARERS